jgi:hypothetical protein
MTLYIRAILASASPGEIGFAGIKNLKGQACKKISSQTPQKTVLYVDVLFVALALVEVD